MGFLPILDEIKTYQQVTDTFLGYNRNLKIANGEFFDMKNLTSSYYPILSPRGKRGVYASPTAPHGLIAKDSLCYVDGSHFIMNEYDIDMSTMLDSTTDKQLVSMGAYVIIMPDKVYINTKDLTDFGKIEATFETENGDTVSFALCRQDGSELIASAQDIEPENPGNMALWIDTSATPHVLKQYSATSSMWVQIPTTYVKISAPNIAVSFKQFDGAKISGLEPAQLQDLNDKSSVLWSAYHDADGEGSGDYLVVVGMLDNNTSQTAPLTISRSMPDMDFITESENRLWGCRYGVAANGEVVNEIYASKLGDFKNWDCFMGISTDSYVVSVGTDGQFTGAITHLGYPIFFKENCLHKIYGNFPSNYQVQTTVCRGVQRGCDKSLAIVNEVLYYKARSGVVAYDGSLPAEISKALGEEIYGDAVAGACGNKYYVSMKDGSDAWHLFVYDTAKGLWHREDNTQVKAFCACRGEMYFIDAADLKIKTMLGSGTLDSAPVEWIAETGVIGIINSGNYGFADHKYISRLVVRLSLEKDAKVSFFIRYDNDDEWEHLFTMIGTSLKSFSVPIRTRRCDHFRLKLVGKGDAKIYSFVANIERGSDIP